MIDLHFTESQNKIEDNIKQIKKLTQDKLLKKEKDLDVAIQMYLKMITTEIDKGMGDLIKTGGQK